MSHQRAASMFVVVIAIIAVQMVRSRHQNEAADLLVGRHTQQQMIDLSTPICRATLPDYDTLYAHAEPTAAIAPGRPHLVSWTLTVTDSDGAQLLHMIRDDETGLVQRISRVNFPYATLRASHIPPLSAANAIARARGWMRIIGYPEEWQVLGQPQLEPMRWQIQLSASGRQATLSIDPQHGYLTFFEITSGRAKTM